MTGSTISFRGALALVLSSLVASGDAAAHPWVQSFDVDMRALATDGEGTYFVLQPGFQLVLGDGEAGKGDRLVITVLGETRDVGGVLTRVVEERETSGGKPTEVSRNYFAIDPRTHDVFYFGEDVDSYKHGKVSSHDGGWHHGSNGARFGLIMPGTPVVGSRYYQEQAPGVAMDRAEVMSVDERAVTRAGAFEHCLVTRETSPLEPLARERKLYAPGIGLIREGSLSLVSHGYVKSQIQGKE